MKKRFLLPSIFLLLIILSTISYAQIPKKEIKESYFDTSVGNVHVTSSSPVQETPTTISVPSAYSANTPLYTTSNAQGLSIDTTTGDISIKKADVLILKDLDAVQLQDARLRNLNPFSKDSDNDGLDDNIELLIF